MIEFFSSELLWWNVQDTLVVYGEFAQAGDFWEMLPDELKGVVGTAAGGGAIYGGVKGTRGVKRKLAAMRKEWKKDKENSGNGNNKELEKRLASLEQRLAKLETEKEYLANSADESDTVLEKQIDQLHNELDARIDSVNRKIQSVKDELHIELSEQRGELRNVGKNVSAIGAQVDILLNGRGRQQNHVG